MYQSVKPSFNNLLTVCLICHCFCAVKLLISTKRTLSVSSWWVAGIYSDRCFSAEWQHQIRRMWPTILNRATLNIEVFGRERQEIQGELIRQEKSAVQNGTEREQRLHSTWNLNLPDNKKVLFISFKRETVFVPVCQWLKVTPSGRLLVSLSNMKPVIEADIKPHTAPRGVLFLHSARGMGWKDVEDSTKHKRDWRQWSMEDEESNE